MRADLHTNNNAMQQKMNFHINGLKKVKDTSFRLFVLLNFMLILLQAGCKKYIEVNAPVTSTNAGNVYAADATAAAVLTGMYANISYLNSSLGGAGLTSISLYAGLSADELTLYNVADITYAPYYTNDLTSNTTEGVFWAHLYNTIFYANSVIEGVNGSTTLTKEVKQHLLGEAKFIRALYYFYLINLYGDAVLATTSDYTVNVSLPRSPASQIYSQIINDLKDAQSLLEDGYLNSDALTEYDAADAQRVRPNKWAATALLARVYLYTGDWGMAEMQAAEVINNTSIYGLTTLSDVFKMNSQETIWSLQPVGNSIYSNTGEGALFILPSTGPNDYPNPVYLSDDVVNSFEAGDQRRSNWVGSVTAGSGTYYFPYKYKVGAEEVPTSEYIMVLRLAEQYLIRAEARAQQNNITGAREDLNVIRTRANLPNTTADNKTSLLQAIMHERRVEFFSEWGHRWFDMKRTNTVDAIMTDVSQQKGGAWSPYKSLYPIPQNDINRNRHLVQNPGY